MNSSTIQLVCSVGLSVAAAIGVGVATFDVFGSSTAAMGLGLAVLCVGIILAFIEGRLTELSTDQRTP